MDYYSKTQYLAQVDREDNITGKIEKWEAHKKGILHRGYTAVLEYNGAYILQHRKHPVFDDVLDLSFSSHQTYEGDRLQSDKEAILLGLKREWGIDNKQLEGEMEFKRKIYYQAKDPKTEYSEHEIDYIYLVRLKILPLAQAPFAYGQEIIKKTDLDSRISHLRTSLAPWVKTLLSEEIL